MGENFVLETPLWEIFTRGTVIYIFIAVVFRLVPQRQTGNIAPNDMIALVIIGTLSADAIVGEAKTLLDLVLMILVIIFWDYMSNLAEYYLPRFRHVAQHSPTLLIYKGVMLKKNLRKEKITEQELSANLRLNGISDIAHVHQAVLEADGQISFIQQDEVPRGNRTKS